ncbi:tRNA pseudouridine(55) synthase TruB [Pseudalkalibacillus berkeleyi]|uniref:tRNA pseudouridine synthase B n=1 Tax=Pseudalkalibacillus berkeleyi TaxID=1069813 RepID=A0ABS9H044_9BACL|nr:tRNA pseudouridine(55) synthase TruB [Pseudalkalibacillus berkeleyi]MCF6137152.1 tRNA pseudouridine(55) synthase TruB [Pseudalkalibacillus berkeleyi]
MKEDGILPLHKPRGMTSHDCVAKLRKLLRTKRVGHTGTLDPAVTGVLPICVNRATKVAEYMSAYNKTYEATISIGTSTTTEDQTGEVVEQQNPGNIALADVQKVLESFVGEIEQTPPMFSAVKVKGKRLYEYAREGITIERPSRKVMIHSIELLSDPEYNSTNHVDFSIRVTCSKGTYIRTLAVDIGKSLGKPAHMSNLTRTKSGPFSLEDSFTFEEIEQHLNDEKPAEELFLPIEQALSIFPAVTVTSEVEQKILNGAVIEETKELSNPRSAVYNERGECLAIYVRHPNRPGWVKPEKVIKIH